MRLILALLIPWFLFFTIKRPIAGIICLLLQLTVVGWLPAAIWAVYALGQFKTDKKLAALEDRLQDDEQDADAVETAEAAMIADASAEAAEQDKG